jgi:DnaJ family protein B protein 13
MFRKLLIVYEQSIFLKWVKINIFLLGGRQITQEEELLTIKVKPGWKKGTKITFEGMGNERPGICPADITFVIAEKRHPMFRREGDDLELAVRIPLLKALTGCTLSIPLLGGEKMSLKIDDIIYPGYEKIIDGKGMPNSKAQGKRGSFKITFLVDFPKELTDEQRSDILSILQDSC